MLAHITHVGRYMCVQAHMYTQYTTLYACLCTHYTCTYKHTSYMYAHMVTYHIYTMLCMETEVLAKHAFPRA